MYMLVFSNLGFMGMPILQAVCGENGSTAVFYAVAFNIFSLITIPLELLLCISIYG